jgi:hypothetical protein
VSKRSPVMVGEPFALPFSSVVGHLRSEDSDDPELERLNAVSTRLATSFDLPPARTNCFYDLGSPKDSPGISHILYFSRRPVSDKFTIEKEFKVSGYLSYNYLHNGSFVTGLIFNADRSRTYSEEYKLSVGARERQVGYKPNFNLETMGLLMFVAEDSSTLVIPHHVESGLLVRAD